MKKAIPILGERGWSTSPQNNMLVMLEHALAADALQSNIRQGNVLSIQRIIIDNGSNPDRLASILQDALEKHYSKMYESVSSEVTATETPGTGLWQLNIHLSGIADGVNCNLAKAIQLEKDTNNFKLITELYANV
jgi:hypothetical protein